MAKKKYTLVTEFDYDYTLIVIKTTLEDFRLAYFLNKFFNIRLTKKKVSLDFKNKRGSFAVFDFENLITNEYWALIANKQVVEKQVTESGYNMFEEISNTFILIPEEKTADYLLKIENLDIPVTNLLQKINKITRVITSYEVNPNNLKSKDLLIF